MRQKLAARDDAGNSVEAVGKIQHWSVALWWRREAPSAMMVVGGDGRVTGRSRTSACDGHIHCIQKGGLGAECLDTTSLSNLIHSPRHLRIQDTSHLSNTHPRHSTNHRV
jgi:hypothetical protein